MSVYAGTDRTIDGILTKEAVYLARIPDVGIERLVMGFGGGAEAARGEVDWLMKTKGVRLRHAVELPRADPSSLAASGGRGRREPSLLVRYF